MCSTHIIRFYITIFMNFMEMHVGNFMTLPHHMSLILFYGFVLKMCAKSGTVAICDRYIYIYICGIL